MDNKKLKEIVKKKLKEYYIQNMLQQHSDEWKEQNHSENAEAIVAMGLLDSFGNPFLALFIARDKNLCSDVICDDRFLYEAVLECCTPEEVQNLKISHCLSIYGRMTEQEREQWEEKAIALLDNYDS